MKKTKYRKCLYFWTGNHLYPGIFLCRADESVDAEKLSVQLKNILMQVKVGFIQQHAYSGVCSACRQRSIKFKNGIGHPRAISVQDWMPAKLPTKLTARLRGLVGKKN